MTMTETTKEVTPTYLAVKWTTSRGAETYGYNICTVTDQETGKRFKCMGGGYDMLGTSVGEWIEATYQDRLMSIRERAYTTWTDLEDDGPFDQQQNRDGLYGMSWNKGGRGRVEKVSLDGACGIESIERIAKAIGIKLARTWDRKGHTTGYVVTAE